MKHFTLCGVAISAIDLDKAFDTIDQWVRDRKKTYVCVVPAATVVACQRDDRYRRVVNQAGMATPDGMPVVWLGRFKGERDVRRTYGPDLMRLVCQKGQGKGYRHYFYGATPETLDLLEERLRGQFSRIEIVGKYAPPFRPLTKEEDKQVVMHIQQCRPDILWVGLGSPKQDFWMTEHREALDVPVMIGVGAAFDFLAGTKPQAPSWMQRSGLEWLFRLCCEPRRLWKRYLVGNAQFVYYVTKDLLITRKKSCV